MLQVVFTHLEDNSIRKFERIDFEKAVELTAILEMKCREEKRKLNGNFHVVEKDGDGEALYNGTFVFGSYYAPNLYVHIKKKLDEIKMNKQQQREKIIFLAKMEDGLPEIYKQEEVLENAHLIDLDTSRVSKLKKWQRRSIYAFTGVLTVVFAGTVFYLVMMIAEYDTAYNKEREVVAAQETKIEMYQKGLLGSEEELMSYYKKNKNQLTEEEKKIYAGMLLNQKDYKEVVSLYENDLGYIATLISSKGDTESLREFNKDFPSEEGKFDLLYADKKYAEMLKVTDVEMTVKRSEMKTYALLKTGKIDEAKTELANNNNKDLAAKIDEYEKMSKEIKEYNEAIKIAKDSKKEDEVKALTKKKQAVEKKVNTL